ncbi:MAG: adenylate/guanylate cyclase domain-containing protein [Arcanobacterium sp.]|nr:adenylate/guanylate cyclase domain-containing protein [Arcanobacterium sp.]
MTSTTDPAYSPSEGTTPHRSENPPETKAQPTTVETHVARLLGGASKYSLLDVSEILGIQPNVVRRFWRAMGFPGIRDAETKLFTEYDIDVLRAHLKVVELGLADSDSLNSLIRAQSHLADRMVLWQYEALVEEFEGRYDIDELSARYMVLDHIDEYEEFLVYQMKYAWRRHLAAMLRRSEAELQNMASDGKDVQLTRSFGFVDLVSFTHRSGNLTPHALIDFIQTFEFASRDVISQYGARVVKMVGDAVLYVADDLETGITVVDEIVRVLRDEPNMPDVRASLVWGPVVSRFGDIFGPKVNLASRLCDVAPVNGILVDSETAAVLNRLESESGDTYSLESYEIPELQGIGSISAALVKVTKADHRDASGL